MSRLVLRLGARLWLGLGPEPVFMGLCQSSFFRPGSTPRIGVRAYPGVKSLPGRRHGGQRVGKGEYEVPHGSACVLLEVHGI